MQRLRIGVVGFSREQFDQPAARAALRECVDRALAVANTTPDRAELVSGLTNQGVPRLAYELAKELGIRTVGVSAKQALRVRAGVFPVDERVIVGERFGDESEAFLARIDVLIRVGGGAQSRGEVAAFRKLLEDRGADVATALVEREVAWFGSRRPSQQTKPRD
jgi:hypothetical protein